MTFTRNLYRLPTLRLVTSDLSRPVETGGAARAAGLLAELL